MNHMYENPETVTIDRNRYNDLIESEAFLVRLEAAGVDNWEGYSEAFDYDEDEDQAYVYEATA